MEKQNGKLLAYPLPSDNLKKEEEEEEGKLPNNENQHYLEEPNPDHGSHPSLVLRVNALSSF